MLRHRADVRTIAYLCFTVALAALQWKLGYVHPVLYPLSLFMGVAVAVISHNHNHLGIFRSRGWNLGASYVISLFYGYPAIGWVPTHNQVHHKYNNGPEDSSRSPKYFKGNHLLGLLVYPTMTGLTQSKEIHRFLAGLWKKDRTAFLMAISEYVVFFGVMAALLVIDWKKALLFFVIPQQFALFMIQCFNYVQHVETNTGSKWNHSRNFVSPVLNALLFNNGYHTVHHHKPGVHWSQTPALHRELAPNIHPSLLERSWWRYMAFTFLARPFLGARGRPQPIVEGSFEGLAPGEPRSAPRPARGAA